MRPALGVGVARGRVIEPLRPRGVGVAEGDGRGVPIVLMLGSVDIGSVVVVGDMGSVGLDCVVGADCGIVLSVGSVPVVDGARGTPMSVPLWVGMPEVDGELMLPPGRVVCPMPGVLLPVDPEED